MGEGHSKDAAFPAWRQPSFEADNTPSSRLLEAVQRGQTEIVTKLLRRGKKIGKVDEKGDTSLHKAAMHGHVEIVALLLKKAPELAAVENFDGLSPFHLAAQYGKLECARMILDVYPKFINVPFSKNPVNLDYSLIDRSGKIVWNIYNFSKIEEKKIYSDIFQLGGYKWRLVLYPKGSKGDDNLSLYLEVANHEKLPEGWSHLVSFTFGIVNQFLGECKITREVIAHRFYKNHTDLGYPQLVKKSTLLNRKSGCLVRDRLQIALSLKPLDSSAFGSDESSGSYTCRLNSLGKAKDQRMVSNVFYISGCPWILAVYPKGKSNGAAPPTLSAYLKVAPPSSYPHYYPTSVNTPQIEHSIDDQTSTQSQLKEEKGPPVASSSNTLGSQTPLLSTANSSRDPSTSTTTNSANNWYYVTNFRISLINQIDGTKFVRSVDAKTFKHKSEDWGFPQFIKLSALYDPDNGFVIDDAIIFEVSVEIIDCVRPIGSIPSNFIQTLPSTPSFIRPALNQSNPYLHPNLPVAKKPSPPKGMKVGTTFSLDSPIKNLAFTPLHWAVYCGNIEAVTELCARGADIDALDANQRTPLDWACYHGNYDIVKYMLSQNASVKTRDIENARPLHKASLLGSMDVIQLLLQHHSDVDADLIYHKRKSKLSVELHPSRLEHLELASTSGLDDGAKIESKSSHAAQIAPDTILDNQSETQKTTEKVLDDPDKNEIGVHTSNQSESKSISKDKESYVSQKDGYNADRDLDSGMTASPHRSHHRKSSNDEHQLSAGSIHVAYFTPLYLSMKSMRSSLTELLVEDFRASLNFVDSKGRTPLHIVSFLGDINLLELFLSKADHQLVNYQDRDGYTPLHKAICRGYFDCVQILLNAGADVGIKSRFGFTPLHYAILLNELQCAKLIIEFDRRRGNAPVPLRDLDVSRRQSDVVESDAPLLCEKKKVSVSISDTIQLHRPENGSIVAVQPSATSSQPPPTRTDRAPLGILHHPPGSEAAAARSQRLQRSMRGNTSDEEPFETKQTELTNLEEASTSVSRPTNRRRSVNFNSENAVVRIKRSSSLDLMDAVDNNTTSTSPLPSSSTPPRDISKHSSADNQDLDYIQGNGSDATSTTNSSISSDTRNPNLVFDDDFDDEEEDDGALSADSQEITESSKRSLRKRANTTGNDRSKQITLKQKFGAFLSDDDIYDRYNLNEDNDQSEDSPEESSESLSIRHPRAPRLYQDSHLSKNKNDSNHIFKQERRGRQIDRAPKQFAEENMPSRELSFEMDIENEALARHQDGSYQQTHFANHRSRSTDAFRSESLIGSNSSTNHPPQANSSTNSTVTTSGEVSKRPTRFSGLVQSTKRAFSRVAEFSNLTSSTPIATTPSHSVTYNISNTSSLGNPDSEGAVLKRARIQRSSSSSSLEHNVIRPSRASAVPTSQTSPATSPPTSPVNHPRNPKQTLQNRLAEHTRTEDSPVGTKKSLRKSRSPPPSRRPKSGSISTVERDQALSVTSPRPTSPRHPLASQQSQSKPSHAASADIDLKSPSPPPNSSRNGSSHSKSASDGVPSDLRTELKHSQSRPIEPKHNESTSSTTSSHKKRKNLTKSSQKNDQKVQIVLPSQTNSNSGTSPRSIIHSPYYTPLELIKTTDINGWFPLHTAVKQSNLPIVQFLISKGAPINDLVGKTSVLDCAVQNQDVALSVYLLERDAQISESGPALLQFVSQKLVPSRHADYFPQIPPSTFLSDMKALLMNNQFYDVTFMVEGKPVHGWKGLLATRCEVFRAMFSSNLREATETEITITDVSYGTFTRLIEFIYTDSVASEKVTLDEALQLLAAANRYILDRLKTIVERWLITQLSNENVVSIFQAADLYQANHLRSACVLFLATNADNIIEVKEVLNSGLRNALLDFLKQSSHEKPI